MRLARSASSLLAAFLFVQGAHFSQASEQLPTLQVQLLTDTTIYSLGERVGFNLRITTHSDIVMAVGLHNSGGSVALVFKRESDDTEYRRTPYRIGPLAVGYKIVRLKPDSAITHRSGVHLLSSGGEQVPPGMYLVRAVYEHSGSRDRDDAWKGETASEPVRIEVVDAEPREVEFEVPTNISVSVRADNRYVWGWDPSSMEAVTVTKRPGFATGVRSTIRVLNDGEETGHGSSHTASSYSQGSQNGGLVDLYLDASTIDGDSKLEIIVTVEIVESASQDWHSWRAGRNKFKVLWSKEFRAKCTPAANRRER